MGISLAAIPTADLLNGILVAAFGIEWFSLAYKSIFFLLLPCCLVVAGSRSSPVLVVLMAIALSVTVLTKAIYLSPSDTLAEVWIFAKGPLLFAAVWASLLSLEPSRVRSIVRAFAISCWGTIGSAIAVGAVTGLGFRTYEREAIGFQSYFVSGNEITFLFVVAWWLIAQSEKTSSAARVLVTAASLVVVVLIATKAGFVLMALLLLWALLVALTRSPWISLGVAIAGGLAAIVFVEAIVLTVGPLHPSWPRIEFFVERMGVARAITGGRTEFIKDAVTHIAGFGPLDWLIGSGFEPFWRSMSGKTVESDPFDLLGGGGLALLFWIYGICAWLFSSGCRQKQGWHLAGLVFGVVVYSVFVGHVLYANTPMIALAVLAGAITSLDSKEQGGDEPSVGGRVW